MRSRVTRGLALVVLASTALACSGSSDGATPEAAGRPTFSSTTSTTGTTGTTPTTVALVGKDLVVTEQGVSSFPDPYDATATLGGYGVVLRNPNPDLVATGVRVTTRVLDAAGVELLVDSTLLNAVLPTGEMAVGRTLIEPIDGPSTLAVAIEVSAWLRPARGPGAMVVSDVVTGPEESGGSVTTFTVRSTLPDTEEGVDITAIYRATDGRILGAESTTLARVPAGEAVRGQIRLLSPIPDLVTTEVYVGRGFAALTGD